LHLLQRVVVATLLSSCATHITESVEYPVTRYPIDDFAKLDFLGIPKIGVLQKDYSDFLMDRLKGCRQYTRVSPLNTTIKLATGEPEVVKEDLKKSLAKIQDTRYVHGILVVDLIKNLLRREVAPTRVVNVIDHADYDWFDSFGIASYPQNELFGGEEIAPKRSFEIREGSATTLKFSLGLRYLLFNKEAGKIVFDRTSVMEAWLTNYSQNPVFDRKELQFYLMRQMMLRIERHSCPKLGKVKRNLYAEKSDRPADRLVIEGINLAEDGKWDRASDQWRKAILMDRKNVFAHHNLGIFYERNGNLPAAIEEFYKARSDARPKGGPKLDAYEQALDFLRPAIDPESIEPRVYSLGPVGWVSILGGDADSLKMDRLHAVYRVRNKVTPNEAPEGLEWTEVGKVKLVKRSGPFLLGRIVQHRQGFAIDVGDVLIAIPD